MLLNRIEFRSWRPWHNRMVRSAHLNKVRTCVMINNGYILVKRLNGRESHTLKAGWQFSSCLSAIFVLAETRSTLCALERVHWLCKLCKHARYTVTVWRKGLTSPNSLNENICLQVIRNLLIHILLNKRGTCWTSTCNVLRVPVCVCARARAYV